ncbi:probable anion transporter 4, chloroplastic isoform X4 [Telopea speciosissima]|uniref:probable anion transporter 4, chloroplastic isoform X4 n=1 Tax=Telopea speciosissima TaxID=54955 RepID=UPI001CC78B13|nr:probable anion transporter 4, chloroplastic isoform X4 [Telopea speciosissima]
MAVGAVLPSRNFGYFLGSGKVFQTEQAGTRQRGEHQGVCGARYARGNIFNKKSPILRKCCSYMSRNLYSPMIHLIGPSDMKTGKRMTGTLGEVEHLHSYPPFAENLHALNLKQRIQIRCKCFISSYPPDGSSVQPRKLHKFGLYNGHVQHSEFHIASRTRAEYKSEEYDIAGAKLDSLSSSEVPNEAALVEGSVQNFSWREKFPKRWVIVLLCFSAFLLCNMDRVNMSIAILPMSQEFNWNSATVGLIQSSFFWGYLLTQIVGGIWADKVGGKLVLGFGVVWWSIATILTPIAAKLGLPFLLIMRAFMGIGEAHSSPKEDPELSADEKLTLGGSALKDPVSVIPWKLILSKRPVWALIISHFCHNWGTFILLTWMPTYYNQVLKFNLTESGLLCVLPWLTMAVFANIGGWIADTLVTKGLSITAVRKIMQSIGFLGPAFFLTQLSHVRTPALAVLCMACSQGSDAFSQSGLYSNHQDIGPRYAGVLLGLSNTAGVLAGVFGTAATGYILQRGSWDDVFKVAVALYIFGTLVWNFFSTGEKILE